MHYNIKQIIVKGLIILMLPINSYCQNVQDVKIGSQIWQSKNLDVTEFRNGDKILEAKTNEAWINAAIYRKPAWCYYNFKAENGKIFGKLYNLYAVIDDRGLAPLGYHIPLKNEFEILQMVIKIENSGKKLKSKHSWNDFEKWIPGRIKCTNCENWSKEFRRKIGCLVCKDYRFIETETAKRARFSGNGSDNYNFSGLPGGRREKGEFIQIGIRSDWWSSTLENKEFYFYSLYNSENWGILLSNSLDAITEQGKYVRCIKDLDFKVTGSNKIQVNVNATSQNVDSKIPAINPQPGVSQIEVSVSGWPSCVQKTRQKIIFVITDINDIPVTYFKELRLAEDYLAMNEKKGYEVKKEACIFYFEDCDLDPQGPFSCEMYLRKNGTFVSSGDYKVGKWRCSERNRVQYYDIKLE